MWYDILHSRKKGNIMENESTKEFIINSAKQLFLEKGYKNVTVMDICNFCSITKTTFYYHLKSKEDIILDFYDNIIKNLSQQFAAILYAPNHWEQLMACFEYLIDETLQYGSDLMSQLLISNLNEDSNSFDFRSELTEVAVAVIKNCQSAGDILNTSDARSLYIGASYIFLGMEVTWSMKNGEFDWRQQFRKVLQDFFIVKDSLRIQ